VIDVSQILGVKLLINFFVFRIGLFSLSIIPFSQHVKKEKRKEKKKS